MEEPRSETALAVSVCVKATVAGRFESLKDRQSRLLAWQLVTLAV